MIKRNPVQANEYTLNQTPNHAFFSLSLGGGVCSRFFVRRRLRPGQPSFPPECPLKREGAATAISNSRARAPATLGWWAPWHGVPAARPRRWLGGQARLARSIERSCRVWPSSGQRSGRRQAGGRRASEGTATVRSAPSIHPRSLLHPLPVRPSVPLRASPCRAAARAIFARFFPPTQPSVRRAFWPGWHSPLIASVLPTSPRPARARRSDLFRGSWPRARGPAASDSQPVALLPPRGRARGGWVGGPSRTMGSGAPPVDRARGSARAKPIV